MSQSLPTVALLQMEYVFAFFEPEMFAAWPGPVEGISFEWDDDGSRFVEAVREKRIDIIIGNIPATAYDRIEKTAAQLESVRFIPSLETQRLNRSKEEVVLFCRKEGIAHPETHIFHDMAEGEAWLQHAHYPQVIRRSYGPSNYGGYHSHLVHTAEEARAVIKEQKCTPLFVQKPVQMRHNAEFRVILMEHKPLHSYWYCNETPGALSVDEAPQEAIELAIEVSRAADAPYIICSIAVDEATGEALLLECATGFAAAPELRSTIAGHIVGQLLNDSKG